jgi:phage tail sheath protein FI
MAEFLSPGVFIEEVSNAPQQIEAVGTSTMGIVGFTPQGPVDEATLVTSPEAFSREFGGFTSDSHCPLAVSAFFNNGGTRAYVVRVVPSDAVAAEGWVVDAITGEVLAAGDGSDPQTAAGTAANVPITPGSLTVSWTEELVAITGENPVMAPAEDGTELGPFTATAAAPPITDDDFVINWTESVHGTGTLTFAGTPADGEIVTIDAKVYTIEDSLTDVDGNVFNGGSATTAITNLIAAIQLTGLAGTDYATSMSAHPTVSAVAGTGDAGDFTALVGGTAGNVVSTTNVTAGSWSAATLLGGTDADVKTASIDSTDTMIGTDAANIASHVFNRTTGALTITFLGDGPDTDSITFDYTPLDSSSESITDDGAGVFSGSIAGTTITGTVDYATGAVSVTWTDPGAIPAAGQSITMAYSHCMWDLDALHKGVWGNRLYLQITGNDNFFSYNPATVAGAGTWTKFDVAVLLENETTGTLEVQETYEEVDFFDTADLLYFPTLLNESSDYLTVVDNGELDVPADFKGITRAAVDMGTPSATDGVITLFQGTLANAPLVNGSLVITSSFGTATADAQGNITGAGIDTNKDNTINYVTGVFTLNFSAGPTGALTGDYISTPASSSINYQLANGSDGDLVAGFNRSVVSAPVLKVDKRGMFALDRIDEVMQLVIPDFMGDTTIMGDMIDYAEDRQDIFALLATPQGFGAQDAKDFKLITFGRKSKYAAMYWPWIKVADPTGGPGTITMPPVAHVAGVIARTDNTRNVGKAPGGTVDGALRFLVGLESKPDKGERDTVYPARINPLIDTPQTGMAVWGVRTMSPTNDIFRYINAVRLFQFVEKSTFNSTQFAVFENINTGLFNQLKTGMDSFLNGLFNSGHFAGDNPSQAYFVVVDGTNNTPDTINQGKVIVDVGIAPNRPAEFVVFRFAQKTLS